MDVFAADVSKDRLGAQGLRTVFVLSLLPLVVGLVALAQATPPDPLWIAGIYDAADYDDVVSMLINSGDSDQSSLPAQTSRLPALGPAVVPFPSVNNHALLDSSLRPRSPPAPLISSVL